MVLEKFKRKSLMGPPAGNASFWRFYLRVRIPVSLHASSFMNKTEAFEAHRSALTGHCYRMLGSVVDAEDAVQETLVKAWRHQEQFDGRSSLRTWLYRIATRVCLDALSTGARRARPVEEGPSGRVSDELQTRPRTHWLEPVPDAMAIAVDATPNEKLLMKQSIRLAFVTALQHLPPRSRAALILTEVLGWSAGEVAETLSMTPAAVNSALQRARAVLATRPGMQAEVELTPAQTALVQKYVLAFEQYDVERLTSLLTEDATLCMPPFTLWLQGPTVIADWLKGPGAGCKGSRLVPVEACGAVAFAQYRNGGADPFALIVLDLGEDGITGMTSFLDTETLFPRFQVPPRLLA